MDLRSMLWLLPHDVRRSLFKLIFRSRYKKVLEMRSGESLSGGSLRQFDEHKCIFVHIPKCAGVSVCKSLFGNLCAGHMDVVRYQLIYSEEEFNSFFKFTIVRNPWDRLVSAYFFLKKGGFHEKDRRWAEENISDCPSFSRFVRDYLHKPKVFNYPHFRPQYTYMCDYSGRLQVDYVGRLETITKDFDVIKLKIGLPDAELGKLNRRKNRFDGYRDHYDVVTRDIVANLYKKDIQLLGYSFD